MLSDILNTNLELDRENNIHGREARKYLPFGIHTSDFQTAIYTLKQEDLHG